MKINQPSCPFNAGAIKSLETLTITSLKGNVINRQGQLQAGSLLQIDAAKNIENLSGQIKGQQLTLHAGENIINETLVDNVGDVNRYAFSRQGQTATLSADKRLTLKASQNIIDRAGLMEAQEALNLSAANDIRIEAQEQITGYHFGNSDHYQTLDRKEHLTSRLNSGGTLNLQAGKDLHLEGASITAGQQAQLQAAGNINLMAVANTREETFHYSEKGSLGGSDKSTSSETSQTVHQGVSINTGGDLNINSGQNLLVYGSTLSSEGNTTVNATKGLQLIAAVDQNSYAYEKKEENAARFKNKSKGYHHENALESSIQSAGKLSLNTQGDVYLSGAALQAGEDLSIGGQSIANVTIDTVALNNEEWSKKSRGYKGPIKEFVNIAAFTLASVFGLGQETAAFEIGNSEEQRSAQTLQHGSALNAQNLSIQSENTTRLSGADVNVTENLSITANTIQIDAVADTSEHYQAKTEETVKGLGAALQKDQLSLGGVQHSKEKTSQSVTTTTWNGTTLNAGNINLNATKNINITSSSLNAEEDINLTAGNDLNISGQHDQTTATDQYSKETETLTAAVRNAYVDTAFAIQAVADATKDVSKANKALSEAKQKVKDGKLREKDLK